jgi:NADH-quinone oxidoreductase subunit D
LSFESDYTTHEMVLNMGPSHPATHGIIRILATLDGERVKDLDIQVGYLHRAFEKMCESLRWQQVFPYTDRLNYVSPLMNNVGYAMAVEKLLGIEVPERTQYIRMIACEISRLCDHLTCIGPGAMELGAFTAFLYCIEARDLLWDLIERQTGARVTPAYVRIGGLAADIDEDYCSAVGRVLDRIQPLIDDIDTLLTTNQVFLDRMKGIGVLSAADAIELGVTGPLLRAAGVRHDLRKARPYMFYDRVEFDVPVGTTGDNYDRYLVRMEEMRQSARILRQLIADVPEGQINVENIGVILPEKREVYETIEGAANHFMLILDGIKVPAGEAYSATEAANGELGFYVVSDGSGRPLKCRVRGPSFLHMQAVKFMVKGSLLSDVVPVFGMINMIGGECDR